MSRGIEVRVGDHVMVDPSRVVILVGIVHELRGPNSVFPSHNFDRSIRTVRFYKRANTSWVPKYSNLIEEIRDNNHVGNLFRITDIVHDENGNPFAIFDTNSLRFARYVIDDLDSRMNKGYRVPIVIGVDPYGTRIMARDSRYTSINEPPTSISIKDRLEHDAIDAIRHGNKMHEDLERAIKENPVTKDDSFKEAPENAGAGVLLADKIKRTISMRFRDMDKIDLGLNIKYKPVNIDFKDGKESR